MPAAPALSRRLRKPAQTRPKPCQNLPQMPAQTAKTMPKCAKTDPSNRTISSKTLEMLPDPARKKNFAGTEPADHLDAHPPPSRTNRAQPNTAEQARTLRAPIPSKTQGISPPRPKIRRPPNKASRTAAAQVKTRPGIDQCSRPTSSTKIANTATIAGAPQKLCTLAALSDTLPPSMLSDHSGSTDQ